MLGSNGDPGQPGSAIAKENIFALEGHNGNSLKIGINSRAYFQPPEGYRKFKFTSQGGPRSYIAMGTSGSWDPRL